MTAMSPEVLQALLDKVHQGTQASTQNLQKVLQRQQLQNPDASNFTPSVLSTNPQQYETNAADQWEQTRQNVQNFDANAAANQAVGIQNTLSQQALQNAQKQLAQQQAANQKQQNVITQNSQAVNQSIRQLRNQTTKKINQIDKAQSTYNPIIPAVNGQGSGDSSPGNYTATLASGLGNNLAADKNFNFNAGLQTYKWNGFSLTLNASVAPNVLGFLTALKKAGYTPSSIGSYSDRSMIESSAPSLHSFGLAIDIDASKNPYTHDTSGNVGHTLPSSVGDLANKYGLVWGGDWHTKKDYMHFSVPIDLSGWGVLE